MAQAIGNSVNAVSQWKSLLTEAQTDRVIAAAWRSGISHKLEPFLVKRAVKQSTTTATAASQYVSDEAGRGGDER